MGAAEFLSLYNREESEFMFVFFSKSWGDLSMERGCGIIAAARG